MELAENKYLMFCKDKEIEDIFDLKFYHPFGYRFALIFNRLGFSPNTVSIIGMFVGILGGFLIYYDFLFLGAIFIVLASVLDSSDGQLARMTGKKSIYGRIIDGLAGYLMFGFIYLVIGIKYFKTTGYISFILMIIAGLSNIIHSSVYDFYRTAIIHISKNKFDELYNYGSGMMKKIYIFYSSYQKAICSVHMEYIKNIVEKKNSILSDSEILEYRKKMLSNIQFINLLGDNWKINGIIILSFFGRIELFFLYVIVVLNIAFIFAIIRQRRIDEELYKKISFTGG
ncbi:MAG: CDP-alcohol phosphatidyltransferase family protein [Elusimicrobiota bacterium]